MMMMITATTAATIAATTTTTTTTASDGAETESLGARRAIARPPLAVAARAAIAGTATWMQRGHHRAGIGTELWAIRMTTTAAAVAAGSAAAVAARTIRAAVVEGRARGATGVGAEQAEESHWRKAGRAPWSEPLFRA